MKTTFLRASALAAILLGTAACTGEAHPTLAAPANAPPQAPAASLAAMSAASWQDESGARVSLAEFEGAPVVVTSFYRSCTVRCPMTVAKLRAIEAQLIARGTTASFVLVTMDPHNDTPDKLAAFKKAQGLPGTWHFLSGSDADTRALLQKLDVHAAYDLGHIDHDVRIVLFAKGGARVRSYRGWTFDDAEAAASL